MTCPVKGQVSFLPHRTGRRRRRRRRNNDVRTKLDFFPSSFFSGEWPTDRPVFQTSPPYPPTAGSGGGGGGGGGGLTQRRTAQFRAHFSFFPFLCGKALPFKGSKCALDICSPETSTCIGLLLAYGAPQKKSRLCGTFLYNDILLAAPTSAAKYVVTSAVHFLLLIHDLGTNLSSNSDGELICPSDGSTPSIEVPPPAAASTLNLCSTPVTYL